jgi:hypothetical protein
MLLLGERREVRRDLSGASFSGMATAVKENKRADNGTGALFGTGAELRGSHREPNLVHKLAGCHVQPPCSVELHQSAQAH